MSDFQSMKSRAIKALMRAGAADYIDLLIDEVEQQIPAGKTFTKDDLIELLRGVSEGMREN